MCVCVCVCVCVCEEKDTVIAAYKLANFMSKLIELSIV